MLAGRSKSKNTFYTHYKRTYYNLLNRDRSSKYNERF
jgi:hypothetical protein